MRVRTTGFTLIEMAVVLSIIATLAAVLTPLIINYIDQARVVRATADVKTLADAIRLYRRDTGRYPIYSSSANASADTAAAHMLIGSGTAPALAGTWAAFTTTTDLTLSLNVNQLGLSTGAQVPNISRVAFRGPYIGAVDPDPWGNRYIVTATNLRVASTNWAFVVSAGPNGTVDTSPGQATTGGFTTSSDDLVGIIN